MELIKSVLANSYTEAKAEWYNIIIAEYYQLLIDYNKSDKHFYTRYDVINIYLDKKHTKMVIKQDAPAETIKYYYVQIL